MKNIAWALIAWLVSRPVVFRYLLRRAVRTPYSHIGSADGFDVYMYRFWLFNPYSEDHGLKTGSGSDMDDRRWQWLPSIRIHRIMRPDGDRDPHNHPWHHARTIVLSGGYEEIRMSSPRTGHRHFRTQGDTATLNHDLFHRITHVSPGGAYTLFFTWKKAASWGFRGQDGVLIPWRKYLGKE